MDQGVHSFTPYSFEATNVIGTDERTGKTPNVPADTVAYFEYRFDIELIRRTIVQLHLTHGYHFKDTSIRLASDRDLDGVVGLEAASSDVPAVQ